MSEAAYPDQYLGSQPVYKLVNFDTIPGNGSPVASFVIFQVPQGNIARLRMISFEMPMGGLAGTETVSLVATFPQPENPPVAIGVELFATSPAIFSHGETARVTFSVDIPAPYDGVGFGLQHIAQVPIPLVWHPPRTIYEIDTQGFGGSDCSPFINFGEAWFEITATSAAQGGFSDNPNVYLLPQQI